MPVPYSIGSRMQILLRTITTTRICRSKKKADSQTCDRIRRRSRIFYSCYEANLHPILACIFACFTIQSWNMKMCVKSFCSCIPSTVWPLVSNWQGKFMLTSREVGLSDKTWWGQILRCLPLNLLRLSGNPIINSTSHYRKKTVATMPTVCSLFFMISWMLYYIRNSWQYIPLWALKQKEWWPTI
jgi:hypothetical protein